MNPAGRFLRFIRFSHTVFALPFALGSMFVAAGGRPGAAVFAKILLAMVFARTAAMTFNRVADWEYDLRNPRTEGRHRLVNRFWAGVGCALSAAAFVAVAATLNPLCAWLSPVALAIVFFYSFTKRFTHLAQFFLGLALAVAPVGAWLAVRGEFAGPPLVLAAAVLLWVAGFDIIYATQDYEVDRREGLRSMVVWLGIPRALQFAQILHLLAWAGFAAFGFSAGLGKIYFAGVALIALGLWFEHRMARAGDIDAINRAFFQANAAIGAIFVAATLLDTLFHGG